jgi:hypothetical protein
LGIEQLINITQHGATNMNYKFTALVVSLSFPMLAEAGSLCDKSTHTRHLKQTKSLHSDTGKQVKSDALECFKTEWRYLSERLTFRGLKSEPSLVALPVDTMAVNMIHYSPASQYSANVATPVAFRTQPVVNVNYLPRATYLAHQLDTTTYRAAAPHLADEVPTSNYQGSLPNPIIYQTGHWNVNVDR